MTTTKDFDKYLGQEVWVKCWYKFSTNTYYVRFLATVVDNKGETWYQCNAVSCSLLEQRARHPEWNKRTNWLTTVSHIAEFQSKLLNTVDPEDVLTTEELFEQAGVTDTYARAYQHNLPILKRIAGKPYWLYVRHDGMFKYICVYDLVGDIVTFSEVDADYVVDYVYRWGDEDPWIAYDNGEEFTAHVAEFVIFEPVEIFTCEEFEEIILQNQEIWEAGRAADGLGAEDEESDWEDDE